MRLTELAVEFGVNFVYHNGEESQNLTMLETLGGGVGLFDYDQDGDLDIFFPGGGSITSVTEVRGLPGALFRQDAVGKFSEVTRLAGVGAETHYTHGTAIADTDNDGFPDLLVTGYGGLQYFHNQGDGTFLESALASGLEDRLWSSSAAWGDLNEDGTPDLYVAHYVNWSPENNPPCKNLKDEPDTCPPRLFEPLPHTLYFSRQDGTYRDGSQDDGLALSGKGLGVLFADVDLDGHLDVYVANDGISNSLYHNEGVGHLLDISGSSGTALNELGVPNGSMGVDLGDYDLDGLPDLWVSNYERESFALYRNLGGGLFRNVCQMTGITAVGSRFVSWGTVFFDADCDGDEDVFVVNGHVVRYSDHAPIWQVPLLFENLKGKRFEEVAAQAGAWTAQPHPGRGCAAGDLDLDGDLDLAVSLINHPAAILINETPSQGHWLSLRLIGRISSRDATGARVTIRTTAGRQSRQVKGGGSYASSNEPWLYFGLGPADEILEAEIRWPSGILQTVSDLAVGQRRLILEPLDSQGLNR